VTAIQKQRVRINEQIKVPEIRLIGADGQQVGVMPVREALALAAEANLDLVEVAPQASPPVCRSMKRSSSRLGRNKSTCGSVSRRIARQSARPEGAFGSGMAMSSAVATPCARACRRTVASSPPPST